MFFRNFFSFAFLLLALCSAALSATCVYHAVAGDLPIATLPLLAVALIPALFSVFLGFTARKAWVSTQ